MGDKINKEKFSIRMKLLMEMKNETVYTIAELLHLSPATISRYSSGLMAPKTTTIEMLAFHFNINPAWLLGYDVDMEYIVEKTVPKEYEIQTIAAHHDGDVWTEEELNEIERFKTFVKSKRQLDK